MSGYRYTITSILILCLGAFVFIQVLFSSLPFNPSRTKIDFQKSVFTFLPQGWAFFTRSPREAQVVLYCYDNGDLKRVNHKHSSHYNIFGLRRKSTAIMSELQYFKMNIPEENYINTEWNYQRDLIGEIPENSIEVSNEYSAPLLCGEYVLVFQEPVPWAWLDSVEEIKMPAKVIKLDITCQN